MPKIKAKQGVPPLETRWKPGQSGNPNGRPRKTQEIEDQAKRHADEALKKLASLMKSDDDRVALQACQAILDRGVGRPKQTIDTTVTDKRDVADISDGELADIATSGSKGASAPPSGAREPDRVH